MVCSSLQGEFGVESENKREGHGWQGGVGWMFSEGGLFLQCWEVGRENLYVVCRARMNQAGHRRWQCHGRGS